MTAVLADPRLARVSVLPDWLPVGDPNRAVLDAALGDAQAIRVEVRNSDEFTP